MAVKGPVWAELLYGDLTSRTWSDLDLLVGRGQVARAREVLQEMGFEDCGPFGERAMRSRWGDTGQIALGSRDLGLVVDLHWKLTVAVSPRGLTSEPVLARAATVTVLGEQVRCPGESDVFIITCLEGTRDLWSSVARVLDLGMLISRTTSAGWTDLLAAAEGAGCERRVLVGVGYVSRLLSLEIPELLTARMETDRRTKALLGRLRPSYLCGAPPSGLRGRLTLLLGACGGGRPPRRRPAVCAGPPVRSDRGRLGCLLSSAADGLAVRTSAPAPARRQVVRAHAAERQDEESDSMRACTARDYSKLTRCPPSTRRGQAIGLPNAAGARRWLI